ncbi:uncharacterized protein LOC132153071 isoform X2 [Carassius carassius]|uniref:uncharacterized protein LOC132153071 isoform X2 n=1 Tax=Carassius carassius TaxID=217509 RepID=UPI0028692773|nr:uncharacterized protein LOC132153071 isoform X2 [Carassius carassius]
MKTLALLTLLLIMNGFAVGQIKSNVTGFVGQNVLLPCNCSNDPEALIWQRDQRIVNVHPYEKIIDDAYVDRTQLFLNKEKRNCSLLLINVSSEDTGLYTSHALVRVGDTWSRTTSKVYLTVSEMNIGPEPERHSRDSSVTAVSVSVPILVIVLILAASLLLTLLIRRRHRTNKDTDLQVESPMLVETSAV